MNNSSNINFEVTPAVSVFLGLSSHCGLITNICSFIYIAKYLKITPHIKKILLIESIYSVFMDIFHIIGLYRVVFGQTMTWTTCSMFVEPLVLTICLSICFSTMISIIRFYMASHTGNNELVDHIKIEKRSNLAIAAIFAFLCCLKYLNVEFQISLSPLIIECAGTEQMWTAPILLRLVVMIAAICTCLYFDVALIKFIRLQNKVQPVRMVAWVSLLLQKYECSLKTHVQLYMLVSKVAQSIFFICLKITKK
jgi:hypothetical protein